MQLRYASIGLAIEAKSAQTRGLRIVGELARKGKSSYSGWGHRWRVSWPPPPPPALRQSNVRTSLGGLSGTPIGCPLAFTPVWRTTCTDH